MQTILMQTDTLHMRRRLSRNHKRKNCNNPCCCCKCVHVHKSSKDSITHKNPSSVYYYVTGGLAFFESQQRFLREIDFRKCLAKKRVLAVIQPYCTSRQSPPPCPFRCKLCIRIYLYAFAYLFRLHVFALIATISLPN